LVIGDELFFFGCWDFVVDVVELVYDVVVVFGCFFGGS